MLQMSGKDHRIHGLAKRIGFTIVHPNRSRAKRTKAGTRSKAGARSKAGTRSKDKFINSAWRDFTMRNRSFPRAILVSSKHDDPLGMLTGDAVMEFP
jgi:hypothetical protein